MIEYLTSQSINIQGSYFQSIQFKHHEYLGEEFSYCRKEYY